MAAPIEQKAAAGPLATLIAGYAAWACLYFVPGLDTALPSDIKGQLPVVFAFVIASAAAYFAPHTGRPDLAAPEPAALPRRQAVPAARAVSPDPPPHEGRL